jgi:putative transposase
MPTTTPCAESVFATLECELLARRRVNSQAEAGTAVFEFIEGVYNRRRRHSSIGYLSPVVTSTSMPPIPTRNSLPSCSRPSRTSPFGRPQVAVLDSRSARRLRTRAGRNGRMASPGAEPKNVAKQEDEMTSHHIP